MKFKKPGLNVSMKSFKGVDRQMDNEQQVITKAHPELLPWVS